jgi:hypothetical protein
VERRLNHQLKMEMSGEFSIDVERSISAVNGE